MSDASSALPAQRLDKWLFFARVVKSRSLAAKLIQSGHVRVNRDKTDSVAKAVRAGDVLTVTLDRRILVLKVAAPGSRRGPYEEARLLYEDLTPPEPVREAGPLAAAGGLRDAGSGRPTKKERRDTDRLKP